MADRIIDLTKLDLDDEPVPTKDSNKKTKLQIVQ